jgi:hypothetical protein
MNDHLTIEREIEESAVSAAADIVSPAKTESGTTTWLLIAAQIFVLMAYAMAMAFLIKTTAGTLVLFSMVAPALVGIAVLTLIGVAVHQFQKRHGASVFQIYDQGQVIFRQGELGDCAYFIHSGEVEVLRRENGAESVVGTLSEGEYFGEKALISSTPRSTTTRALSQTRVGIIRKRRFLAMIIVMPAVREGLSNRTNQRLRKWTA